MLTPAQQTVVIHLRRTLLLPLDDLLAVTRELICPHVSRSGLDWCLRRHGAGNLNALKHPEPAVAYKSFKSYEPGYVHMDVKYLPQMEDESQRRYLFVAIDRATRWVFVQLKPNKTAASAQAFLKALHKVCPLRLTKLLPDNGKDLTDRLFASRERKPSGNHEFDQLCQELGIEHRLTKPRTPKTNGMVERFDGRIADVLKTHQFNSREDMEQTLLRYVALYNHQLPQSALGSKTPMQAMKEWYQDRTDLFYRRPYDRPGYDKFQPAPVPAAPATPLDEAAVQQQLQSVIARDGVACEVSLVRSEVEVLPLARTGDAPTHSTLGAPGFGTITKGGKAWRTYVLQDGELRVATSDRLDLRAQLTQSAMRSLVLTFTVALAGVWLLVWLLVTRGLRPLARLQRELRQRQPQAIEPVRAGQDVRELRPVVDSLNALLARSRSAIEHERRWTADASRPRRTPPGSAPASPCPPRCWLAPSATCWTTPCVTTPATRRWSARWPCCPATVAMCRASSKSQCATKAPACPRTSARRPRGAFGAKVPAAAPAAAWV